MNEESWPTTGKVIEAERSIVANEAGWGSVAARRNVTECGSVADEAEPGPFSVDANMAVPEAVANVANISEREAVTKKVDDGVAANKAWRHSPRG